MANRTAVKFALPFGELVFAVPGALRAAPVEHIGGEHVFVELRSQRGELISLAAYRDLQALMGREVPIVWARGPGGEFVRVTEFAKKPSEGAWWDGVLERVIAGSHELPGDAARRTAKGPLAAIDVEEDEAAAPPARAPRKLREHVAHALRTNDSATLEQAERDYRGVHASVVEYLLDEVAGHLPPHLDWLPACIDTGQLVDRHEARAGRVFWTISLATGRVMVFESTRDLARRGRQAEDHGSTSRSVDEE